MLFYMKKIFPPRYWLECKLFKCVLSRVVFGNTNTTVIPFSVLDLSIWQDGGHPTCIDSLRKYHSLTCGRLGTKTEGSSSNIKINS